MEAETHFSYLGGEKKDHTLTGVNMVAPPFSSSPNCPSSSHPQSIACKPTPISICSARKQALPGSHDIHTVTDLTLSFDSLWIMSLPLLLHPCSHHTSESRVWVLKPRSKCPFLKAVCPYLLWALTTDRAKRLA